MKKQSLSNNFIFQMLYQVLVLVIPLILSPYLSRVLQETALGVYTYANSISSYFIILANLGISVHGKRVISVIKDERKLRITFWSLYAVHFLISIFSIVAYSVFALAIVKSDRTIFLIEIIYVASALFDITWLFYGLQNFSSVVKKNTIVKVIECMAIFALVKSPDDLWKYTAINAVGMFLGQAIMIPQAIRIVRPIRLKATDMREHIKPLLIFSVSVIASTMYTTFDKTLLGLMSTKENVAFYEYANKIVSIPQALIGVFGTVMFPRACKFATEGNKKEQIRFVKYSFVGAAFIGMGTLFGLLTLGDQLIVLYLGEAFQTSGHVAKALSPLAYIVGTGSILRSQCMIPNHMDKEFNLCIVYNAVINLLLSCALIPVLGIYGAVIGTLSAEIFGLTYQLIKCRSIFPLKTIVTCSIPFAFAGMFMFVVLKAMTMRMENTLRNFLIEFFVGILVYMIAIICYYRILRKETFNKFLILIKSKLRS